MFSPGEDVDALIQSSLQDLTSNHRRGRRKRRSNDLEEDEEEEQDEEEEDEEEEGEEDTTEASEAEAVGSDRGEDGSRVRVPQASTDALV